VNAYDPKLLEQQRKLGPLETRMARYEKTARLTVILVIILAALALGALFDQHLG